MTTETKFQCLFSTGPKIVERPTLLKGDLRAILRKCHLSLVTMRNIRQNLFFAFVYNVVGVPLAAGVLFPAFRLLLNPMIAAAP